MLPRPVGGGAANDGDVGRDRREVEPRVAVEVGAADDRLCGGRVVHGAALVLGVDEGIEADLGEHARPLGRGIADHVVEDSARHVVGRDRVVADQAPDRRHRQGRRAGGQGARDHAGEQAGPREMVDPLDPVHVAGSDGVQRRQSARTARVLETLADGAQHAVGAAEATRRADRDHGAIGDQRRRFVRRDHAGHGLTLLPAPGRTCRARPARAPGSRPPALPRDRRCAAAAPPPNAAPAPSDMRRRW